MFWKKQSNIDKFAEYLSAFKGKLMGTQEVDEFNGYSSMNYSKTVMDVNGLKCSFHMPKAVTRQFNEDGSERAVGLPPGNPRPAFKVDEYPACPTGWMHGSGKAGSFFVPVIPEHGMWLDFNGNNSNKYHVAAVVSVQGINPLTGRKTDPIRLEQYKSKCPVHGIEFKQDRYCETCKHKWPGQNYLSSNNGGPFWLDGFMTEEGIIRQWFFTEEECKGVAAQLIKDQRVFAIGVAFYLSKEPKPQPTSSYYCGITQFNTPGVMGCLPTGGSTVNHVYSGGATNLSYNPMGMDEDFFIPIKASNSITLGDSGSVTCSLGPTGPTGPTGSTGAVGPLPGSPAYEMNKVFHRKYVDKSTKARTRSATDSSLNREAAEIEIAAKKIEIGAGAKIIQRIHDDPESLEFWRDEPEAFLYVNYCDAATCKKILEAGKREESAEGFMEGLKLAN